MLNRLLFEIPHASLVSALAVMAVMATGFGLSGAYLPDSVPWYFGSIREYQGMVLMLTILPAYLVFCLIAGLRRSIELAAITDSANGTKLVQEVQRVPWKTCAIWALVGIVYAIVVNIPGHGLDFFETDRVGQAAIVGQLIIWMIMGGFLPSRIIIARAFNHASQQVEIDIFETTNLKPFAQIGLVDVLIISSAMVLSTLQSLDLEFRPDNYSKALVIVIPAIFYLAIYPMWNLHKRMKAMRQAQLDTINRDIAAADKELTQEKIEALELLLQRRERINAAATWPVDITIVQRFLFISSSHHWHGLAPHW